MTCTSSAFCMLTWPTYISTRPSTNTHGNLLPCCWLLRLSSIVDTLLTSLFPLPYWSPKKKRRLKKTTPRKRKRKRNRSYHLKGVIVFLFVSMFGVAHFSHL